MTLGYMVFVYGNEGKRCGERNGMGGLDCISKEFSRYKDPLRSQGDLSEDNRLRSR